jgi:transketolase
VERLLTLRRIDSDLEGHPTPRLSFVDVATGSLGQGLPAAVGLATGARLDGSDQRVYVLLGDGETAEGSVWEAAEIASAWKLGNLCVTIDINRLGQSQPTLLRHDLEAYRRRWEAFGWQALTVDGHSIPALLEAYAEAASTTDRPTVILARTLKGRGMLEMEDKEGRHGVAMKPDDAGRIVAALEQGLSGTPTPWQPNLPPWDAPRKDQREAPMMAIRPPYEPGGQRIATRKAFGEALAALGPVDPRLVVLDGDVKNSTYTEEFQKACPGRFLECFIAEQSMVGTAMGLAAQGRIPVASTFGCFFTRAYDFIRMAAISNTNLKLAGTHAGVSIGEDGPSQMALEDIAMICAEPNYTVLYPSDGTAAWRATRLAINHLGPCYIRLGRLAAPILYGPEERFAIGKCKVLRQSGCDRALIIAAGVTLVEALAAYEQLRQAGILVRVIDLFSIQPIDRETLVKSSRAAGGLAITVEDHYAHGGLGDAVHAALAEERIVLRKMAVCEIPHSGKPQELLDRYGISARWIVDTVKRSLAEGL